MSETPENFDGSNGRDDVNWALMIPTQRESPENGDGSVGNND